MKTYLKLHVLSEVLDLLTFAGGSRGRFLSGARHSDPLLDRTPERHLCDGEHHRGPRPGKLLLIY